MADKKKTVCWAIQHPELGTAWVIADDYERATVKAAEWWGVPGQACGQMRELTRIPYMRNVCPKCGQIYNSDETMCEKCLKIQETERQETARRLKATWWQGKRTPRSGGKQRRKA